MKILVISNFYPPYHLSGYEVGCRDIVESLKARGHNIRVLTSTYGIGERRIEGHVYRWLRAYLKENLAWRPVVIKEVINQTAFKEICLDFQPEIVFMFNLSNISISLGTIAQEIGLPTCYYISDNWFITKERDHWYQIWSNGKRGHEVLPYLSRKFKLITPSKHLNFKNLIFTNRNLKNISGQLSKIETHTAIIPWGIDNDHFSYKESPGRKPKRLLYVGKIKPNKNLDTAIKALGILKRDYDCDTLSLNLVGKKFSTDYVSYLRNLAEKYGVLEKINFSGFNSRKNMMDLYQAHDIFIFPSVCEDSSSIAILEAMSCGLPVVSTAIESLSDVLKDEFDALVFPKDNPKLCATQILRFVNDPLLFKSIRRNARNTIEERFCLGKSVISIEEELKRVIKREKRDHPYITFKDRYSEEGTSIAETIDECVRRATKQLKFWGLFIWIKKLLKPRFYIRILKKAVKKIASLSTLQIFSLSYKIFLILVGRRSNSSKINIQNLKNILVIQMVDIGDIILSSPFLRELRRSMPYARIVFVVQPKMLNLVEKCPYVDEVLFFNWRSIKNYNTAFHGHIVWWLQAVLFSVRNLWKYHFDLAISLHWNNDPNLAASIILMLTSGAPQRVAYLDEHDGNRHHGLMDLSRLITNGPFRSFPKHEIELQLDILRFLGINFIDNRLEVWTSEEDERFMHQVLQRYRLSDSNICIAIAPGSRWAYRRWPASRFIELGRWLQEKYEAYILILAGKSEIRLGSLIEKGLQKNCTINLTGQTTLREMASVLRSCKLFIGNDSGPMHIAAAVGVPVVGLFSSGEYERFKPGGTDYEVIRLGLSCNPCSENCKFEEARCILGITVSQVKKVLIKKLKLIQRNNIVKGFSQ